MEDKQKKTKEDTKKFLRAGIYDHATCGEEVAREMINYRVGILALQEISWNG